MPKIKLDIKALDLSCKRFRAKPLQPNSSPSGPPTKNMIKKLTKVDHINSSNQVSWKERTVTA